MKYYLHEGKTYTRDEYFALMFGEEFMNSNDKGELKQYKEDED